VIARERRSKTPARYPSLASFYNADERRSRSREQDVGLWWREQADGPLHRAAWIEDTGELYVTRLGPTEEGGGSVELLAVEHDQERLLALVAGWRERVGAPRSLSWLRERATRGRDRRASEQLRARLAVSPCVSPRGA
jgi:hypothetical protein